MTLSEQRHGTISILTLKGSFVGRPSVSVFEHAIFDLLKEDVTFIVLDLAPLRFIDSAGLGAIISAMVSARRKDGALKIAALGGDVQNIVKRMNLDRVFDIYETVPDAETSFVRKKP